MALTSREYEMLNGLCCTHSAYVSASEYNIARALCERGLAHAWNIATGPIAWRITDEGRKEVAAEEKRLRA